MKDNGLNSFPEKMFVMLKKTTKNPDYNTTINSATMPVKTMECPSCAMEIDSKSENCPICGYEFPKQSRWIQIVAVLLVLLFLYMIIF